MLTCVSEKSLKLQTSWADASVLKLFDIIKDAGGTLALLTQLWAATGIAWETQYLITLPKTPVTLNDESQAKMNYKSQNTYF